MESAGLYLHIPFCQARCSYCDFNTYTGLADLVEPYVRALEYEIRQVGGAYSLAVPTIFFGGGTPSLMSLSRLADILGAVRQSFDLDPGAEITLEANPGTVDAKYLAGLRELGVNRISFGVQSSHESELGFLGRIHSFAEAVDAVHQARHADFDNLNLDLIFGLPYQTLDRWGETVRRALDTNSDHLSLYCLTIERGTPLQSWVDSGTVPYPDPDLAADMYLLACETLAEAGFDHYEISNWAKPGRSCRHNLIYWRNQSYLGIGAGAHGYYHTWRYHNVLHPRRYIRRAQEVPAPEATGPGGAPWSLSPSMAGSERIGRELEMGETMMMGLRLLHEGISRSAFQARFGVDVLDVYPQETAQLKGYGLLQWDDERVLLTERGWLLGNEVFSRFLPD